MLEPKPGEGEPDPSNPTPLKDEKPGFGEQHAPDESGLPPKDLPPKE